MGHRLFNRKRSLFRQRLVLLEHCETSISKPKPNLTRQTLSQLTKRSFLQRLTKRLGEVVIHKHDLKSQETAVRDEVLPADVGHADGVNKSGQELGRASKQLKDDNSPGPLGVGPKFDEVR